MSNSNEDLDQALDTLYLAPLSEFIPKRDSLAKELLSEQPVAAKVVKGLKKPTVGAWALNQVALKSPKQIEWLLEVYQKLRSPSDSAEFRDASKSRNKIVTDLVDTAVKALESGGHAGSESVKEKIARTLQAVATDAEAAEVLRRGRLSRELEPSGFSVEGIEIAAGTEMHDAERRMINLVDEVRLLAVELERIERNAQEIEERMQRLQDEAERSGRQIEETRQKLADKERELEEVREELQPGS